MSSSGANQNIHPGSHLKSTQQELKKSVVDGGNRAARGDPAKSTAQALKETNAEAAGRKGGTAGTGN